MFSWVSATPAYSAQAMASITCQNSLGESRTFGVGWNNEHTYFMDKGNIAQHFCEGGYAGEFTTFVGVVSSDGGELDSSLLYFAGLVPSPSPSPEELPESAPALTEEVERTEDVQRTEEVVRTETIERTEEVQRPVEPAPEPTPEPTPEETKKPSPKPTEQPTPEPTEEPVPEPTEEPSSEPVPPVEPMPLPSEEPTEELPLLAVGKLIENLKNIGSDMTPEVREQAQQVVIASIIVSQIAITAIGRKP